MDEILHGIISEGNFDKCKRRLVVGCLLNGVLDVLCKVVCPKEPSYYKLDKCDELEEFDLGKINNDVLTKLCKVLVLANRSDNVCKFLTSLGLVFADCISNDFILETCDAIKILEEEEEEIVTTTPPVVEGPLPKLSISGCDDVDDFFLNNFFNQANEIIDQYNSSEITCNEFLQSFGPLQGSNSGCFIFLCAEYRESYDALFDALKEECPSVNWDSIYFPDIVCDEFLNEQP
jgi:hypothetical protein